MRHDFCTESLENCEDEDGASGPKFFQGFVKCKKRKASKVGDLSQE